MKAHFPDIRIAGVLGVVPRHVSRFDDELHNYAQPAANSRKLKTVMGYDQHRVALPGVTTADLAASGLRHLIEAGLLDVAGVDALLFVSQTPDYLVPATSACLHGQFGFPQETYCVDINDGCAGYIKALYEASAFLTVTGARRALVIAGDVLSARVSPHDRNSYPLVGDAATLTVVERSSEPSPLEIELLVDGRGWEALKIPAGGARMPSSPASAQLAQDEDGNRRALDHLVMQGREVFAFTQTVVPEFILSFLARRGLRPNDMDLLLLHQANAFILDRLRTKLEVDATKLPDEVIRRYGNSSSATVPLAMALACAGREQARILACGFGVGLSWGAAMFETGALRFCEVIETGEEHAQ